MLATEHTNTNRRARDSSCRCLTPGVCVFQSIVEFALSAQQGRDTSISVVLMVQAERIFLNRKQPGVSSPSAFVQQVSLLCLCAQLPAAIWPSQTLSSLFPAGRGGQVHLPRWMLRPVVRGLTTHWSSCFDFKVMSKNSAQLRLSLFIRHGTSSAPGLGKCVFFGCLLCEHSCQRDRPN